MRPSPLVHARHVLGMRREAARVARALRALAAAGATASDVVDAVFATGNGPFGVSPVQSRTELVEFAEYVRAERPTRVVEVGTGVGGTLYVLAWASAPGAQLLSLDRRVYPAARRTLYRKFVGGRRVEVIEADSHLAATRERVARHFGNEPLDLLFIDGDHGYESVSRDYQLYGPLLREGGVVAFHDIVDGPPEHVGGVPRFWRELKPSLFDVREFVESWSRGAFGIGVGRRRSA